MISPTDTAKKKLSSSRLRILEKFAEQPARSNLEWSDFEGVVKALGGEVKTKRRGGGKGGGSSRFIVLGGRKFTAHEPHNRKELGRGLVERIQQFFLQTEILEEGGQ